MITEGQALPHGKRRVLVIDDEGEIRDSLDTFLSLEGYEVSTAENGARGLAQAKDKPFDVAITDLKMPGLSGSDTIVMPRPAPTSTSAEMMSVAGASLTAGNMSAEISARLPRNPISTSMAGAR